MPGSPGCTVFSRPDFWAARSVDAWNLAVAIAMPLRADGEFCINLGPKRPFFVFTVCGLL